MTTSYYQQQADRIKNAPGHKATLRITGSESGKTNSLSISEAQLSQIVAILENGDDDVVAEKATVIEEVTDQIETDMAVEDFEAMDELLNGLPLQSLKSYLSET